MTDGRDNGSIARRLWVLALGLNTGTGAAAMAQVAPKDAGDTPHRKTAAPAEVVTDVAEAAGASVPE